MADALSPLGRQVKEQDHDRYLTLVFAPAARREALFALNAFNQELARTAERVSEPLLGEMRFTWWRDALEAMAGGTTVPDHPVSQALADLVASGQLDPEACLALIEARRRDLDSEGFLDEADLTRYAADTAGQLNRLTAALSGLEGETLDQAARLGTAWGLIGQLRSFDAWRRRGRIWLPQSLLRQAGLTRSALLEGENKDALAGVAQGLAGSAEALLSEVRGGRPRLPSAGSAFLLGTLSRIYLRRLAACRYDLTDPALALLPPDRVFRLTWAVLRRRW